MRALTTRRIAWTRGNSSARCWARAAADENGPDTTRLGAGIAGDSGGERHRLWDLCLAVAGRAKRRQFHGAGLRHRWIRVHDLCGVAGRAQSWMRGHLWLGLLSLPMILFHGGFHFGGALTRVLMWLTMIVVVSGVYGAVLQNYLPSMMTRDVPLETIYDEIGNVRKALRMEADALVERICGRLGLVKEVDEGQRAGGFTALRPIAAASAPLRTSAAVSAGASAAVAAQPEIVLLTEEQSQPLRLFYFSEVRAFLEAPAWMRQRLGDPEKARNSFAALRRMMPPATHAALDDLLDICDETRQLMRQERLHRWLHGWLLLHIPLSLALILLGAIHAVMALRY